MARGKGSIAHHHRAMTAATLPTIHKSSARKLYLTNDNNKRHQICLRLQYVGAIDAATSIESFKNLPPKILENSGDEKYDRRFDSTI